MQSFILWGKVVFYAIHFLYDISRRALTRRLNHLRFQLSSSPKDGPTRNIVIIGASFAGYQVARTLAHSLPPHGRYRLVVVEPHSHFHFTWVLPRFCVVEGHEHKAFIPYAKGIKNEKNDGIVRWVSDTAVELDGSSVKVGRTGERIPYAFLVVATGSGTGIGLPSRVDATEKSEGIDSLRKMQGSIASAENIVVVGGGAAGVQLATDAKGKYRDKRVTLVHSRDAVMHRFGAVFQATALEGLRELGVDVVLGERMVEWREEEKVVLLRSGRRLECDFMDRNPRRKLIASFMPALITESNHIRVKPTLQLDDDSLSNVYACGDVASTGIRNPNARAAYRQAMVVVDNILLATRGKAPRHTYEAMFGDGVIKLTLGLDRSVTHFGDGFREVQFGSKEKDLALMSTAAWKSFGATPFEDEVEAKEHGEGDGRLMADTLGVA